MIFLIEVLLIVAIESFYSTLTSNINCVSRGVFVKSRFFIAIDKKLMKSLMLIDYKFYKHKGLTFFVYFWYRNDRMY